MNFLKCSIRKEIIIFYVLVFLLFLFSCSKSDEKDVIYSEMELEILQLINQYRIKNKIEALEMNTKLYEEASSHTNYMIKENRISHNNSGERFSRLNHDLGISSFAENVARGQKSANDVVLDWLNSEGHRANIVGDYNLTGISAKRNQQGEYFYTQIFTK